MPIWLAGHHYGHPFVMDHTVVCSYSPHLTIDPPGCRNFSEPVSTPVYSHRTFRYQRKRGLGLGLGPNSDGFCRLGTFSDRLDSLHWPLSSCSAF